jgi:O-antigen/teichoic acid export membrane protein
MAVFGDEFVWGWPVIIVVAAAQLFSSSVGPTARVLAMTGHQRIVMVATLGSTVAAAVLNLLLVPAFGIFGAAVATAAAVVLVNVVTVLFVHQLLGFWPFSAYYARPIVAGLLAAAFVYLVRLVLPASGATALLVFAPLFLTVFIALLVALGLSPSDRQFLASFWAAVLRSVRRATPRDA